MTKTEREMTETEAAEEALRLLVRKMRRMHQEEFSEVWDKLPEAARWAITTTEARADDRRMAAEETGQTLTWPVEPDWAGDQE